jgi:diguanylate cyclase (GGDEF)-like protein/PAS domain S-box-containing protein
LVGELETEEIFAPATRLHNTILIVSLFLAMGLIVLGFLLSRHIAKPIVKLRDAAVKIGEGKFDSRIEVRSKDELGELAASFNTMTEALQTTTVSRDYMDNILKSMYDSLVVITPAGRIKTVNRATLRLLGYAWEELFDRPVGEIFAGPERFDGLERDVLIEKGYVSNIERTYLSKDGRQIPVLFSASVMRGAGGAVSGIVFMAQDITERKQMLDALREGKEKLNAMLQSITDLMSMIDKDLNIIWANKPAKKFFGEDIVGKNCCEVYYGKKEPCELYPCVAHMVFEDGKGREHDTRVTAKDGRILFFHCTANVALRDRNGKPVAVLEILRDITANKRAEEGLRLTSKVFENTVESIIITDAKQKILQVNEAFTRITGYSPEEVTGKTPDILRSGWHDEKFYKEMWKSINQKGMWQGEVWDRRKNGEVFAGQLTISAIKDEKGSVRNYVGLYYDITEKKRTEERIQHLAYYDALTNLPNRSLFYDRLEHAVASSHRARKTVALMFLDLDNFKIINDTLGHHVGDMLLKACAGRLTECLRKDTTVSRIGGDEFTVILANIKDPRAPVAVSERIKGVLSRPFTLDGHEVFVTTSIGISLYPDDADNVQTLVMNADTAMYHAKEQGGGRYQFFSKALNVKAMERLRMGTLIRHALEKDEFLLHYQPQVDLKTGLITGHEALVRWQQPGVGLTPPLQFIPVAEETGLVVEIDEWVLKRACTQTRAWHGAGFEKLHVAVNFSGLHLRDEGA